MKLAEAKRSEPSIDVSEPEYFLSGTSKRCSLEKRTDEGILVVSNGSRVAPLIAAIHDLLEIAKPQPNMSVFRSWMSDSGHSPSPRLR
jgi:hypothetical protein